jgi:hypothetical protein
MNAPSHQDCTDPRCMTCYMYRYRNGNADSAAKRALRAKLRKNGSGYVSKWRQRQAFRPQLHSGINKLISDVFDYLCESGDLQSAQYIESHRQELFTHLRKACGDLSDGSCIFSTGIRKKCKDYYVYLSGLIHVRPLKEVPPSEIRFFGKDYSYMQDGRLWVCTFAPDLCVFSKKPMLAPLLWEPEIDIALFRWLDNVLYDVMSIDLDALKDDQVLTVFPILLPDNKVVLSANYGIDIYF